MTADDTPLYFICYPRVPEDIHLAQKVEIKLSRLWRANRIEIWRDEHSLEAGELYRTAIDDAIGRDRKSVV